MKSLPLAIAALILFAAPRASAQANYPPRMEGSQAEVYKKIGDVELKLYLYSPPGHSPSDSRPAALFFFGGGWRAGTPQQFAKHCEYLASRGMVAMAADYRVLSRHGAKAVQCVQDANSAMRWVRRNARRLGIDPNRIAAGGGSAGGHLAAAVATLPGLDEPGEDTSVSAAPNALVLFNPALVLAPLESASIDEERMRDRQERAGTELVNISPYHHLKAGAPPALIFHGRGDTTVPFATAEAFCKKMKSLGGRCELVGFDEQPHGFFNYGRNGNWAFVATVRRMDEFFQSLGWLNGGPTLEAPTE